MLDSAGSTFGILFGVRNHAPDGCDQTLEFDRFGIELVAARGNGLLALAGHRMRGHSDDRDVAGLWMSLEPSHGFPAVNNRHFEVHQNYVRALGHGQLAALLAVVGREDLEIAKQLKPSLEHVEVVVVVLDVEQFGHDEVAPLHVSNPGIGSRETIARWERRECLE